MKIPDIFRPPVDLYSTDKQITENYAQKFYSAILSLFLAQVIWENHD